MSNPDPAGSPDDIVCALLATLAPRPPLTEARIRRAQLVAEINRGTHESHDQ